MAEFRVHFLDTVTELCTDRLNERKLNELDALMRQAPIENCFRFASNLFGKEVDRIFDENIRTSNCVKNESAADRAKTEGNRCFRAGQFEQALANYNRGLVLVPAASDLKLVLLSNRSQIRLQMHDYRKCLNDIECIEEEFANILDSLRLKVLWRKSICLRNMNEYDRARTELAKLRKLCPAASKFRFRVEAELEEITACESHPDPVPIDSDSDSDRVAEHLRESNPVYGSLHKSVRIATNAKLGRHAVACQPIECGRIVAVENAYASIVAERFWLRNCNNCLKSCEIIGFYPCDNCTSVVFCSRNCKRAATQSFHKYECGLLKALAEFGVSAVAFLALRLITRNDFAYFLRIRNNLDQKLNPTLETKYENYGYERIYNLITHPDRENRSKFLQLLIVTVILVRFLRRAVYFDERNAANDEIIAELLVKNLQVVQFNGHEINEEIVSRTAINLAIGTNRIGFAIYPSLAFFNHSCELGVVRKYVGNKVVVYALKSFAKNEMIGENYGMNFWQDSLADRKRFLDDRYRFVCECRPCRNNWPSLAELKTHADLRYRCRAASCPMAGTARDWYSTRFQCRACQKPFDIRTICRKFAQFEQLVDRIDDDLTQSNFDAAFESLKKLSELSQTLFAKPNEFDYSIQLGLIRCVLRAGNYSVA